MGGRGLGQSQGLLGRAGSRRSGHQESGCNTEQQAWAVSMDSDLVASGAKASPYLPACSWAPARQWEIFFPVCFSIWETLRQLSSWEEARAQGGHSSGAAETLHTSAYLSTSHSCTLPTSGHKWETLSGHISSVKEATVIDPSTLSFHSLPKSSGSYLLAPTFLTAK